MISAGSSIVAWAPTVSDETLLLLPAPGIVSVRVAFLREETGPACYAAIVVFEDGSVLNARSGTRLAHGPLTACEGWPA